MPFKIKWNTPRPVIIYHFNPIQDEGSPPLPQPVFPLELLQAYSLAPKTFWLLIEPRPALKKSGFSGQILIKIRSW